MLAREGDGGRRLLVAGDSAGGGLTVATLLAVRDAGEPQPAAAALLSPWLDLAVELPSLRRNAAYDWIDEEFLLRCARDYVGAAGDRRHPRASPLHAELRGLPPLLVQVGTAEVLLDEGRTFVERARDAGVEATLEEWPDMVHVWQMFAEVVPEGRAAIVALARFFDARLGAAHPGAQAHPA